MLMKICGVCLRPFRPTWEGKPVVCLPCQQRKEAERGSTSQRGYAGEHARISQMYRVLNLPCACDGCGRHTGGCGKYGTPANPITAGHIIPKARGGSDDPGNYRPECRSCNSSRSNLDRDDDDPFAD